ncbi:MAG: sensor domain-containing diguanylate cyclase [Thalassobaculaceae bacterium]|nr:sensor domain-containing diguanylate cyclase [Thalassobaculaceae bacterium]
MPGRLSLYVLLACLTMVASPADCGERSALGPIALSSIESDTGLLDRSEFLVETGAGMSLDAALRSHGWELATKATFKRGLTEAQIWMHFAVLNDSDEARKIVVTHDIMRLTDFTAYAVFEDGQTERADYDPMLPYVDRPLAYAGPAAALTVPAGERAEVVVRFGNSHPIPIHLNLRLWSESGFDRHTVANTAFFVFWIGCLATAACFWFLYGLFMRQARMIVYAVYMTGVACTYVIFSGVGLQLLFPGNSWFQHLGFNWAMFLLTGSAFEFARRHLDIERLHPRHNQVLRVAVAFYAIATVLAFPTKLPTAETALTYFSLISMPLYITWLSWTAWRRDGLRYASWMVVGWGSVSLSSLVIICVSAEFIPFLSVSHIFVARLTFVGMVFESLLLSASLAQWLRGQEVRRVAAEHAASRDALTGLLNRRGFDNQVLHLKQGGLWPGKLWLALIDLDGFKNINDTFSHGAGDSVLTHLAALLRREFRANDVTARFGGEEFVLLFEAESDAAARSVAERVRQRFADTPTRYEGAMIAHTLSAGLVRVAAGPNRDEATLIAMADTALYEAKRAGRNRVRAYSDIPDVGPQDGQGDAINPEPAPLNAPPALDAVIVRS